MTGRAGRPAPIEQGVGVPVIIQEVDTLEVLMLGFTNRRAVELTLETGTAWFLGGDNGFSALLPHLFQDFVQPLVEEVG